MNKNKNLVKILTCIVVMTIIASSVLTLCLSAGSGKYLGSSPSINRYDKNFDTGYENYLDSSVMFKLPETVDPNERLSLIIEMPTTTVLEAYDNSKTDLSFKDYYLTDEAEAERERISDEAFYLKKKLIKAGVDYTDGEIYDTVLSGFEIEITASDFETVCLALDGEANVIIGDEYEACKTEVVSNTVNVYGTGIFNSSDFGYDGTGTVVAVLDTGLDYFHSAFLPSSFAADRDKLAISKDDIEKIVSGTRANGMQSGITASDVYINEKVPFGFDYADGDSDVFPLLSNHGTHVAGVIAGNRLNLIEAKDYTGEFVGVAPNAQLVIMKIFSDVESTARTSRIIAALEDCVALGVDVINMSIGTGCGFSRQTDKEAISGVYDKIRERGISLVVAASNSFNSTYGSDKNGNLGLTSNPDSATVGSPSTYLGALSVASINGAKTSYLAYGESIIYFNESTDRVSDEKNFVEELLTEGEKEKSFEYVTIPGAGRTADYTGFDVKGKLVLVKRGYTTFEEKANVAFEKGAAGIIIYNNVSGDIKMNVGETDIAAISISQDDGEMLAEAGTGIITISTEQESGPFMSDFSSWGPTPDLKIKPEITAHGGSILSAVPGQSYDRISGTSMACPNISGVSAILRQYVKESEYFEDIADDPIAVTAVVNRLMMSTADIILNKNGLPYSIRKQGAGLANLTSTKNTTAYILTYDLIEDDNGNKNFDIDNPMEKSKIELGDDPSKSGVYQLVFSVNNFGKSSLKYNISASVLTEGVSDTKTSHGETTVTETAYELEGASVNIKDVKGGILEGTELTVAADSVATVTLTITLTDENKKYLDDSFENGMYVEGFVMLDAVDSDVDLNVPYLAFYGDWTVAPLFDLDYFETNKDELDDSIDPLDKTLADAYATRPIGGSTGDYMSYLGSYYFIQDPSKAIIAADRKYISISNQENSINSLRFVWAGLLRGAERIEITITEDSTGEVVYSRVENDIRKAYGDGAAISPANVKIEFSATENNLKNNSSYTVHLKGYLDYGDGGEENNLNNEFSFPLVTDFEAPTLTDCEFYTEYDRSTKKTRLFAKVAVYDNHYAMSMQFGCFNGSFTTFDKYYTPVYSEFNSTSYVTYELTDHIDDIIEINNALVLSGAKKEGSPTFSLVCYDYALNLSAYEIALPDNFTDLFFEEDQITLSPYETYTLDPVIYPGDEWSELLTYSTNAQGANVVKIVGNKLIAIAPGVAKVYARDGKGHSAEVKIEVLAPGAVGYKKYDKPVTDSFIVTGFDVNKAFYQLAVEDRDIGNTGDNIKFGNLYALSMYPSESVTLRYDLNAFFPDTTEVVFESSNDNIVKVDKKTGTVTAVSEGLSSVTVKVLMDGKSTYYSKSIDIEVKDPYVLTGPSITHYFGAGTANSGIVTIPETLAVTEIGQFAFSNFDYVLKDEHDEISEEMPDSMKIWYKGDSYIKEVVVPEGIKRIGPYAFAGLTALTKITLPSTLETIDYGAFIGCTALENVVGIENVKFINQSAFQNSALSGTLDFKNAVAIADYAFASTNVSTVKLSDSTQSVGAYAFSNNKELVTLTINADKLKLGKYAFSDCPKLQAASVNASVIPEGAFYNCSALSSMTVGKDVNVISQYAFMSTAIASFNITDGNEVYLAGNRNYVLSKDGTCLILVAPGYKGENGIFTLLDSRVTSIGEAAFSGNVNLIRVSIPSVTSVRRFAFSECTSLSSLDLGQISYIGDYAFEKTAITVIPSLSPELSEIGNYAFSETKITDVNIDENVVIGDGAFKNCHQLTSVKISDGVEIGDGAFALDKNNYVVSSYNKDDKTAVYYITYVSKLTDLTIGKNVKIGNSAFLSAAALETFTLGENAVIGNDAFLNAVSLTSVDLSKVKSIGDRAFSGYSHYEYLNDSLSELAYDDEGFYIIRTYGNALTSVDISMATEIGKEAFGYANNLKNVILSADMTSLPDYAFTMCEKLDTINLTHIEDIGEYAFNGTALTNIDLSSARRIGKYAFCESDTVSSLKLASEVIIEEGAFSYCPALSNIDGEEKATYIGDYAFAYSALTTVDLTLAEYIGSLAFIKEVYAPLIVKLGDKVTDMGDNPFAFCKVAPFETIVKESFNGKEYSTVSYTFDLNSDIKIIDGSVYRTVPNGLELIVWCGDREAIVADTTSRISAMAFAGHDLTKVILPYTLKAIGHKAFFDCDRLSLIVFSSYKAPILEEEYDLYYYISEDSLASKADYAIADASNNAQFILVSTEGLGIVPFNTYEAAYNPSNVFYGANFIDYIGHVDSKISMVRPSNGKNYDSFIFNQYFNLSINGKAAADDTTLAAIAAINKLPSSASDIKLEHKGLVEAARAAYNKIISDEQRGLVPDSTLAVLKAAEQMIEDLEYLVNGDTDGENDNSPEENNDDGIKVAVIILTVVVIVLAIGLVGLAVFTFMFAKKIKNAAIKEGKDYCPEIEATVNDTASVIESSVDNNDLTCSFENASENVENTEDEPIEEFKKKIFDKPTDFDDITEGYVDNAASAKKRKIIIIAAAAFCAVALIIGVVLAIINGNRGYYSDFNDQGYTVSIKFDSNGGSFKGSDSSIVDLYNPEDIGSEGLKILAPDDSGRKENAMSVSNPEHFLAGWYTNMEPIDKNDPSKGYRYYGKWDFETSRLRLDPSKNYSAEEPALTLYAAWVPYYVFEIYTNDENGKPYLLTSVSAIELTIPEWEDYGVTLKMDNFPEREGYTLEEVYYLDDGVKVEGILSESGNRKYITGEWDPDTATSKTPVIKLLTTWQEGERYRIYSTDDFVKNADPKGYYELYADLDFTNDEWPKAFLNEKFSGKIYGNNFKIMNVGFRSTSRSSFSNGLFSAVDSSAYFENLTFENITHIIDLMEVAPNATFGLFAGSISQGASFKNVKINGKIVFADSCESLIGKTDLTIGKVTGAGSTDGITAGKITFVKENEDNKGFNIKIDGDGNVSIVSGN